MTLIPVFMTIVEKLEELALTNTSPYPRERFYPLCKSSKFSNISVSLGLNNEITLCMTLSMEQVFAVFPKLSENFDSHSLAKGTSPLHEFEKIVCKQMYMPEDMKIDTVPAITTEGGYDSTVYCLKFEYIINGNSSWHDIEPVITNMKTMSLAPHKP